jgi:hypothetical protein
VSSPAPRPRHLSPVSGHRRCSREAQHSQLLVTWNRDVRRPKSRRNITRDDFPRWTGVIHPMTRDISLEDKGVGGSGPVTERQKFRTTKVCFLFRKPSRFVVRHHEWQATKKSPIYIHILSRRQQAALITGLLGRRPEFPREEEGLVAEVANDSRACRAPSSPSSSEATHVEGGCSDRPDGGSPNSRKCFDRRLPRAYAPRQRRAHARGR